MKYIICFYCLLHSIVVFAQPNKIFEKVKPRTINFDVSFNVRIKNDKGEVVGIKNLMNIPDNLKEYVDSCGNKKQLVSYLKNELYNGKYDWEANILLYYIMGEDCLSMFPYEPNKVNLWLKEEKEKCVEFWKSKG